MMMVLWATEKWKICCIIDAKQNHSHAFWSKIMYELPLHKPNKKHTENPCYRGGSVAHWRTQWVCLRTVIGRLTSLFSKVCIQTNAKAQFSYLSHRNGSFHILFSFHKFTIVRSFRVSVVTLLPRKTQHTAVLSKVTGLGRGKDCGDLCILFLIVNV